MQPIIRDSEDEDEEEFLVTEDHAVNRPSQQSNNSWMINTVDEILADNPSQKSERADHSSLSTGNLQRQIADASRGLFDSTSTSEMKERSLASSATPATKKARRHSAAIGSQNSAKVIKRTKTTNVTYGSSKTPGISDPVPFDTLRDEEVPGTLQTNFANHEPTVMFRDTGNTIADNESSQQRMIEQALNRDKQLSHVDDQEPVDFDKPDSSPFPWAESSIPTQTPGGMPVIPNKLSSPRQSGAAPDVEMESTFKKAVEPSPQMVANTLPIDPPVSRAQSLSTNPCEPTTTREGQLHSPKAQQPLKSSPHVSLPRVRVKSNTEAPAYPDEAPKGRKRKASTAANTELLNSDDRAIGHPKELYQPRLSRRRATGMIEQPQDFSIVPEKTAKRRRNTTTTAAAPEVAEDELALGSTVASQAKAVPDSAKLVNGSATSGESTTRSTIPATMESTEKPPPDRGEVRALLKDLDFPLTNTSFDASRPEKPSPTKDASPLSVKKQFPTAATIAMPPPASPAVVSSPTKRLSKAAAASAMPPPSSSAKRISRRSHTTIFEDHVDFGGSQPKSPSLRQQQADRKSAALKEVKNIPTQAPKRKRRSIVQDEDDDEDGEDELIKDHVAEVTVAKKSGRPTKAPAPKNAKQPPPADRILQDSDGEPDDESIIVDPPKMKGRVAKQPPAKAARSAERVLEDSEDDFDEHVSEDDEPPKKKARGRPSKATTATQDTSASAPGSKPSSRRASAASDPPATPPSDKQLPDQTKQDVAAKPPAPTKTAPTAHTPIKTSSKVIRRVGLNRTQRVQPLLKIVRPPAPPAKKRKDG